MPKITITIEGDTEELKDTLTRLFAAPSTSTPSQPSDTAPQTNDFPELDHWTRKRVEDFWRRIKPNARRILAVIARHPDGIGASEIQQALSIAAPTMAGSLSSVGFAMNYLRKYVDKNLDFPHWWDSNTSRYYMKPAIASIILELYELDQPDQ